MDFQLELCIVTGPVTEHGLRCIKTHLCPAQLLTCFLSAKRCSGVEQDGLQEPSWAEWTTYISLSLSFKDFLEFIYLSERERKHERGEGQRENQTPC